MKNMFCFVIFLIVLFVLDAIQDMHLKKYFYKISDFGALIRLHPEWRRYIWCMSSL